MKTNSIASFFLLFLLTMFPLWSVSAPGDQLLVQYEDDAKSLLASGITAIATTATVVDGTVFPAASGADDYFYVTIVRMTDGAKETVKVSGVSGNVLTISARAQGTGESALAFSASDSVTLRMGRNLLDDRRAEQAYTDELSITDVTALTGVANQCVYAAYHTTAADAGHGWFCWDASSSCTDDNGTCLDPPAAGNGRWVRQVTQFVTPEMWGGDLEAAVESGYPVKTRTGGAYTVDSTITIPSNLDFEIVTGSTITADASLDAPMFAGDGASNIHVYGSGTVDINAENRTYYDGSAPYGQEKYKFAAFRIIDSDGDIRFEGITIDGSWRSDEKDTADQAALHIGRTLAGGQIEDVVIDGLTFIEIPIDGIILGFDDNWGGFSDDDETVIDAKVVNNRFYGTKGSAISSLNVTSIIADNNYYYGASQMAGITEREGYTPISLNGRYCVASNNTVIGAPDGFGAITISHAGLASDPNGLSHAGRIVDNAIIDNERWGVMVHNAVTTTVTGNHFYNSNTLTHPQVIVWTDSTPTDQRNPPENVIIANNEFKLTGTTTSSAITVQTTEASGYSITGNIVRGPYAQAVFVGNGDAATPRAEDVTIIGNIFDLESKAASIGIYLVDVDGAIVANNNVKNAATGISLLRGNDIRITHNDLAESTAPYAESGAPANVYLSGNEGIVSEDAGAAIILNGTASITVTHGLWTTPNDITLTPFGAGVGYTRMGTANVGATTFDIVTDVNVTADTSVRWFARIDEAVN